jgi:DNA (cytosine-5)-methyltransferase 1
MVAVIAPESTQVSPELDEGSRASAVVRTLDLFAGAGGLTAGFAAASERFAPTCAVEFDVAAAATYALNHDPSHSLVEGVLESSRVYAGGIEQWLDEVTVPEVDIVIGGPPCQGFSTLGKQEENDHRNLLWREYAQTVKEAKPKYFVLENVPAFKRSPQWSIFEGELEGGLLADYGLAHAGVLNAADFGAAQARRRIIVIGYRKDLPDPGVPSAVSGRQTVRQAFEGGVEDLAAIPRAIDEARTALPGGDLWFNGKRFPGPHRTDSLHLTRNYSDLSLKRFRVIREGGNRFDLERHPDLLAPCWKKHKSGSADVMGRLRWDQPSVTIRTEFFKPEKGRYLHPSEHRALSHWEAARLQGFPDDYLWVGSKVQIARQIGNAVPIPLGKAIARHLLDSIG